MFALLAFTANSQYRLQSAILNNSNEEINSPKSDSARCKLAGSKHMSHFSHHMHARSHETSIVVASSCTITAFFIQTFDRESLLWFGSRAHLANVRLGLGCRNCNYWMNSVRSLLANSYTEGKEIKFCLDVHMNGFDPKEEQTKKKNNNNNRKQLPDPRMNFLSLQITWKDHRLNFQLYESILNLYASLVNRFLVRLLDSA